MALTYPSTLVTERVVVSGLVETADVDAPLNEILVRWENVYYRYGISSTFAPCSSVYTRTLLAYTGLRLRYSQTPAMVRTDIPPAAAPVLVPEVMVSADQSRTTLDHGCMYGAAACGQHAGMGVTM